MKPSLKEILSLMEALEFDLSIMVTLFSTKKNIPKQELLKIYERVCVINKAKEDIYEILNNYGN